MSDSTLGIARIWRGSVLPENADIYEDYLYEHGVKKLKALGASEVQMLREDRETECHFMVISWWPDRPSMASWAGDDPTRIRHLERDAELLIELPESVQVLGVQVLGVQHDLRETQGPGQAGGANAMSP